MLARYLVVVLSNWVGLPVSEMSLRLIGRASPANQWEIPNKLSSSKVGLKVGFGAPRKVGQKQVFKCRISCVLDLFLTYSLSSSDLLLSYFHCSGISHRLAGQALLKFKTSLSSEMAGAA